MNHLTKHLSAAVLALFATVGISAIADDADECEYDDCIVVPGNPEDDGLDTDIGDIDFYIYNPWTPQYGDLDWCSFGSDTYPIYVIDEFGRRHNEGDAPCPDAYDAPSPFVPN